MTSASLQGDSLQASLTVNDLEASATWYVDMLGFTVARRVERDGKLRSIALTAGTVKILLNQDDGAKGRGRSKGEGMSFQITSSHDIDAIAMNIKQRGGTLDTELGDTPWGARVFRVRDPDNFRWTISRPIAT
ncbi:MAG: VOC family protein [Gemmatimonadales bacterium]